MYRFGLKVSLIFLVLLSIGRIILPFGDEPDFKVRVERLEMVENKFFIPSVKSNFYKNINSEYSCEIKSGAKSVFSNISKECYELNLKYFFERIGFTFLTICPLIFFIIFQKKLYFLTRSYQKISNIDWKRRVDALSISLLLPSVIYTLGWLSQEVFVTVLSFFVFIFWGRIFLILFLFLSIYTLDEGNAIVVMFFSLVLLFFSFLRRLSPKLYLLYVFAFIFCTAAYFLGEELLEILSNFSYLNKISEVQAVLVAGEYYDKYPLLIRPFITLMSLVFMTASGIKSIFLFIVIIIASIFASRRLANFFYINNSLITLILSAVVTIFLVTITIPTHSYGKYYIFLIPFFVYPLLQVYTRDRLLYFFTFLTMLTYLNIMFFYL